MITSKQTDELNVIRREQLIVTEGDDVIQDGEKMAAFQLGRAVQRDRVSKRGFRCHE